MELLYGDCLELMKDIPDKSIDMILCDLPYGTTNCKWDNQIDLVKLWSQYKRIIKENGTIVLFAQTPFDKILGCSNIEWLRYEWIWHKTQPTGFFNAKKMPMKSHENILVFYNKLPTYHPQKTENHKPVNSVKKTVHVHNKCEIYNKIKVETFGGGNTDRYPISILTYKKDVQKSALHPTQKPVELLQYLIKTYTNEGDVVLDNCMGSGSTGVACVSTNRDFIGMELDKKYFDIAKARIEEAENYFSTGILSYLG